MIIPVATVPPRLEAFARGLSRTYANEAWPEAEMYSIVADALRVGMRVAKTYADPSCVELSQDELEAEARRKMIEIFQGRPGTAKRKEQRPVLERVRSREELFKYLTTCFNNQTRGLVHRHRFTAKRTGSKVPPKGSPELARWGREQQKPEISLDDNPGLRSSREFQTTGGGTVSQIKEIDDDMAETLSPLEFLVWGQLTTPNELAWLLAKLDATRGRQGVEVKITFEHYAKGVGLGVEEFTRIAQQVTEKFHGYQRGEAEAPPLLKPAHPDKRARLTPVEFLVYQQLVSPNARTRAVAQAEGVAPRWSHFAYGVGMAVEMFKALSVTVRNKLSMEKDSPAIAELEEIFEVQVPRSAESLLVRRLFTLVARAKVERVTPQVADLLLSIGADVPQVNAQENLTCFGVLYARNHHICQACQARTACAARAANFGLDKVSLHPQLLPARASVRTAEVIGAPVPAPTAPVPPATEREEEICAYLEHHFRRVAGGRGGVSYTHRSSDSSRVLVVAGRDRDNFRVRFCRPAAGLLVHLVQRSTEFFAPDTLSAAEVCQYLARHADDTFTAEVAARAQRAAPPASPEPTKKGVSVSALSLLFAARARHVVGEVFDRLVVRPLHLKRPR